MLFGVVDETREGKRVRATTHRKVQNISFLSSAPQFVHLILVLAQLILTLLRA